MPSDLVLFLLFSSIFSFLDHPITLPLFLAAAATHTQLNVGEDGRGGGSVGPKGLHSHDGEERGRGRTEREQGGVPRHAL